jgi:hypothetical protein
MTRCIFAVLVAIGIGNARAVQTGTSATDQLAKLLSPEKIKLENATEKEIEEQLEEIRFRLTAEKAKAVQEAKILSAAESDSQNALRALKSAEIFVSETEAIGRDDFLDYAVNLGPDGRVAYATFVQASLAKRAKEDFLNIQTGGSLPKDNAEMKNYIAARKALEEIEKTRKLSAFRKQTTAGQSPTPRVMPGLDPKVLRMEGKSKEQIKATMHNIGKFIKAALDQVNGMDSEVQITREHTKFLLDPNEEFVQYAFDLGEEGREAYGACVMASEASCIAKAASMPSEVAEQAYKDALAKLERIEKANKIHTRPASEAVPKKEKAENSMHCWLWPTLAALVGAVVVFFALKKSKQDSSFSDDDSSSSDEDGKAGEP